MLLDDFSRPLNDRGKKDAPRMGKRLKEKRVNPGLMVTSPARRALATCKRIAEILDYSEDKIKMDRGLYHADSDGIRDVIRSTKDKHDSLMIFGHNPGLTSFVNGIGKLNLDNVPTCGVAAFELPINSWKDMDYGMGELLFYDYPKKGKS
jgi:phosphohistidine phosphatase